MIYNLYNFSEKFDSIKAITPLTFHLHDVMCKDKHTFKTKVSKYLITYISDSTEEKVGKPYIFGNVMSSWI